MIVIIQQSTQNGYHPMHGKSFITVQILIRTNIFV